MTEQRVPLTEAARTVARAVGKEAPDGLLRWLSAVDAKVDKAVEEANRKAAPDQVVTAAGIGPVAVTMAGKLRAGDTVYLRLPINDYGWVTVDLPPRAASADPSRVSILGTVEGVYDGAVSRSWSEPADALVIIRPRPKT